MPLLNLIEEARPDAPETQGIKYAGSKLKLLPYILQLVRQVNPHTVLDGFSGTTRVAQALAQSGRRVIANDIAVWSRIFGTCYLLNPHAAKHHQPLLEHLNALPGTDGWFTKHYGGDPDNGDSAREDRLKKPWQKHNTRRLDAIRDEIERLALPEAEKAVALTSLMLALDEVDSTLGHFVSCLNDWSPRSYKPLRLKMPRLIPRREAHRVVQDRTFFSVHFNLFKTVSAANVWGKLFVAHVAELADALDSGSSE